MKKTVLNIFLLFISINTFAQGSTTSFTVAGIKVILKPTLKEVIDVNMYYRGGVTNYPSNKSGLENLALAATTETGTKLYTANAFRDKADKYGIDLGGTSNYDYGQISMTCISRFFNQGWDLFASAIVNPVFDEREVGLLKDKVISGLNQSQSDPDERIDQLTMQNLYTGSSYGTDPSGTPESIAKLTAAELKSYYYTKLLNKNRMFLVIVGKITKEEITKKILASFASLPSKPFQLTPLTPKVKNQTFLTEQRELATNYLTATFDAPSLNSADYLPFRLAISNLANKLFREIRTKRNLSYAPNASVKTRLMSHAEMYVSTTDPVTCAQIMLAELKDLKENGFTEDELLSGKSNFITNNYMKDESSSAIASSLGVAEIAGDWRIADQAAERISKVTLKELNAVLAKYIKTIKWSYLGNESLVKNTAIFKNSI